VWPFNENHILIRAYMRSRFLIGVLLVAAACSNDVAAPISAKDVTLSTALSSGGMTVTSTSPDSATQDTTLDVTINGSGFVAGTIATWALAGVADSTQVKTNSTRYVSARKLIANITIKSIATVGKWDVVVAASGKGGIGTEAFAIKSKTQFDYSRANLLWDDFVDINGVATAAGIRGDNRNRFGQSGAPLNEYQGDYCGVRGYIYDGNGDGNLDFDADTYYTSSMAASCGSARRLNFYLNGSASAPLIVAPHVLGTSVWGLAPGSSQLVSQRFGMQGALACGELQFNSQYAGSSSARLTRISDTTDGSGVAVRRWRLESQGSHTAACVKMQTNGKFVDSGIRYSLPFAVTITQVRYPGPKFP
jgi:hypothetical protein